MDAVGGASFRRSYNLLRPGGRLVAFGASSVVSGERKNLVTALRAVARMPRFNMVKQMSESKAVIGLNMLSLWKDRGTLQPWIEPMQRAARRRHRQTGGGGGLQLRGCRRGTEHDHRAAQRRQGRAHPLNRLAGGGVGCYPGERCRFTTRFSASSPPPSGGIVRGGRVAANPAERNDWKSASKRDREGARTT